MPSTITLVRHGQTDFNLKHLVHSSSNGTINDTGINQAETLGKFLAVEKYTRIYSSDLQRCQDTAKFALKHLKNPIPEVLLDARLREMDFAEWDGRPSKDLFKMAMERNMDPRKISAPGGETYEQCSARLTGFLKELFESLDAADKEENVIIFTHGLSILYLLMHFNNSRDVYELENFKYELMHHSGNTARSKFIVGKPGSGPDGKRKLQFICLHDDSHL